jgi:hypothetical protein
MGIFAKYLGTERAVNLAKGLSLPAGSPIGVVASKGNKGVNPEAIDAVYTQDPTTFNIVNKQVQLIMHPGFKFYSPKLRIQKYYDEFFENIGFIGEEVTTEELLEYIVQDELMYGNAYVELIYNQNDTEIVDLKNLMAGKMDFAKDSQGNVAIDMYGKPIGYVLNLPLGTRPSNPGDEVPKQYARMVSLSSNQVFFLPKRIAHFKINAVGDRYYGTGIISPAYLSTLRKIKIEEAQTNSIYTRGTYPVIASVGNETHEATTQELTDVVDQLANLKHDRYFAFPDYVKVAPLEVKQSDIVDNVLDYLRINQAAAAGMPMAFATGAGEATNRATLNNQQQIMELTLEYVIKKTVAHFEKYIIRRIGETNLKTIKDLPKLIWGDIKAEEKNEKAKRLIAYVSSGAIEADEIREYASTSEDLNVDLNRKIEKPVNPFFQKPEEDEKKDKEDEDKTEEEEDKE